MLPLNAIKEVTTEEDYILRLKFFDGSRKEFDMKPYIQKYEVFEPLKNPVLFAKATISGGGIIWNDEIDLAQEHLYEHGKDIGN